MKEKIRKILTVITAVGAVLLFSVLIATAMPWIGFGTSLGCSSFLVFTLATM